ncbi:glycosyltransferase family 2 protein [Candidatus Roizmanbacteria bacterium]|nr:glycosyltransferase family 2 protein [Candidatus Roizmanbacteria bacterium]
MNPRLAIITVVYKNYDILADFISSLGRQSEKNFFLYLVDLSPVPQKIQTSIPHQVLTSENKGYAHGVNVGIAQALKEGYSQFCIMNNDTYFEKDFVAEISKALQSRPKTIIGGKIYYAPNFEFHTNRYSPADRGKVLWYAGGKIDWNHVLAHHRGVDDVDHGQYEKTEVTDFITGCLICYDRAVIEALGTWDESYFMYYEDTDYCERAKRANIPLLYIPLIKLWHKNGQSTEGSGSAFHVKYQEKNRVKFGLKYAPLRTKIHLVKNYLFALVRNI